MNSKRAPIVLVVSILLFIAVVLAAVWFLAGKNIAVFNPAGTIADQQRGLIIFASLLSLVIVLPVFGLTFYIVWKYRASNTKARYEPNWDHNTKLESLWWGIPLALIVVLSIITWTSSHRLDPFRPIASNEKPLEIQVVALQWKWLFIYPEQNMATVNFVQFPEDRPVNFTITSDAPMNSFWIPQLGGQMYTMSGMSTKLHLMADQPGEYRGSSANISGEGFADMVFTAKSSTQADFDQWVNAIKDYDEAQVSPIYTILGHNIYDVLARPSTLASPQYYRLVEPGLYDDIVKQFMSHSQSHGPHQPNLHSVEH